MKPRISVVLNTLNEEENLPFALRSVCTWADEIVVVDMHSDDRTVEIAREYGAKVFLFERVGFVEPARQFAVEQATGEWIFILDADEVIPHPLSSKLLQIASGDVADIVSIPWLNYILGEPILHTGWGPHQDRHSRFFKKGKLEHSTRIHSTVDPSDQTRTLVLPYTYMTAVHHFCYLDMSHIFSKLNRYTTIEAEQAHERGESAGYCRVLTLAVREFLSRYFKAEGYKDGWRGFYFSGVMAIYKFMIYAKLQEIHATGGRRKIIDKYHTTADTLISRYGNS